MKKVRKKERIIGCIGAVVLLLVVMFLPLVSTMSGDESGRNAFVLPSWGGGMVHCDPQLTDNIRLPVPTTNVGVVWYRNDFGGEKYGTWGDGIAGNGRIAASTFNNYLLGYGNLIIYDYFGNRLWSDSRLLNPSAASSTPMIDLHDRVVACDNQKIILVNASNHDNVHVEWVSNISSGGVPFSPTIVENRTIIVPTFNGPLYAFDVKTGHQLATLAFWDNSSNETSYGIRDMNWSDFLSILSHPSHCPYHYNNTDHVVEWNSTVRYGIMPVPFVFFEGTIMFVSGRDGVVAAVDMANGSELAVNSLGTPEMIPGGRYYSTQNSACVQGKRVFIVTGWTKPGFGGSRGNTSGRLYAVDVNPDAQNHSDVLKVAWDFSFPGQSQASPTLIGGTLYFDGYNGTTVCFQPPWYRDPHVYAVYTNGTLRWKRSYPNITGFSFCMDPRGGFWYEDLGLPFQGGGGRKLVHFNENGTINEYIDMKALLNDTGLFRDSPVYPCSCMTMCGTAAHPIMIVSANHDLFIPGKWVVAINLSDNNSLLWKVPIKSLLGFNYASGQYTILVEKNESRVLFGTFLGGVMAIGATSGWDIAILIAVIGVISVVIIIVWFVFFKRKRSKS